MNSLDFFKFCKKINKTSEFIIKFSPEYWDKNEFVIYNNSEKGVIDLLLNIFGKDYLNFCLDRYKAFCPDVKKNTFIIF